MIWIVLVLLIVTVSLRSRLRRTKEHMTLEEYTCLLKRVEDKLGMRIVQLMSINQTHLIIVAYHVKKNIAQTYRIAYDRFARIPTDVYLVGGKPMSPEAVQLYLKEPKDTLV